MSGAPGEASPLAISPDPLCLGTLEAGGAATASLTAQNHGREALILERVESSCPCVSVGPVPVQIAAGGSALLAVTVDLAGEPDFRGGLTVDLTGNATDGATMFHTEVRLMVGTSREETPKLSGLPGWPQRGARPDQ